LYKEREFAKFAFLYSTLNPAETRQFGKRKIAKDTFNRVHNYRKQLGKMVAVDKFEDFYSKTFKEDQSKSTLFHKFIYLILFLFLFDRLVSKKFLF